MEESRADLSRTVWAQEQSSNESFGLLCPWNGHIRNNQWEAAVPQIHGPDRCHEGVGRRISSSMHPQEVHGGSVEGPRAVLGISTE